MGNIWNQSAMSSFNSPNRNHINVKRNPAWGFNDVGIFFLLALSKIRMVCFSPFQYVICGI